MMSDNELITFLVATKRFCAE